MPTAPPSRCTSPGCGELATQRSRCDEHQHPAWSSRATSRDELTEQRWAKLRTQVLRDEPLCNWCGDAATEVDHVREVSDGGARYARANLQALCELCHKEKTRRAQIARAARARRAARRARDVAQYVPDALLPYPKG